MKIRKVIGILVCLGIVAFASTASAFSLIEALEYAGTLVCDNGAKADLIAGPEFFAVACDFYGDTDGNANGVIYNGTETGFTLDSGFYDIYADATISGENLKVLLNFRDTTLPTPMYEPAVYTISSTTGEVSERKTYVAGLTNPMGIGLVSIDGVDYVFGRGMNPTTGDYDEFFSKFVPGIPVATTVYSRPGHDLPKQVDGDLENGRVIVTSTSSIHSGDINITSYDLNGIPQFTTAIDHSPSTDTWAATDVANGKIYVATHYVSADTGKKLLHLIKLNADGTTDTENTIEPDLGESNTVQMADFAPIADSWYLGTQQVSGGYINYVVLKVDPATLEVVDTLTDDRNSQYYDMTVPHTEAQSAAFGDELEVVASGRKSDGTGLKLFLQTDGSWQEPEIAPQPYDFKVGMPFDDGTTVFISRDPTTYYALIRAFRPETGPGQKKHTKHVPPGITVPVNFDTEFDEILNVLFSEVTLEGDITIEQDPTELPPLALPAGVEPISAVYRIEVDADYTNARLTIICDAAGIEGTSNIVALRSEVAEAVAGWMPAGTRRMSMPPDDQMPGNYWVTYDAGLFTVTIDIPQFSDWVVVNMPDAASKLEELIQTISEWNLQKGISNALDSKMTNALAALQAENADQRQDAINKLEALINSAEAQRGGWLTDYQADYIINWTSAIIAAYSI